MKDIIVVMIILAVVGAAITYIVKAKKKGVKCIGCPASGCCSASKMAAEKYSSSERTECGCGCHSENK